MIKMKSMLFQYRAALMGLLCLCSLTLAGCQSVKPEDLKLEFVKSVRLADVPHVWPGVQRMKDIQQEKIMLLNVGFSSKTDVAKVATEKSFYISYRAGLCAAGVENVANKEDFFYVSYLKTGDMNLNPEMIDTLKNLERFRRSDGTFLYEVFIPVRGAELRRVFGGDFDRTYTNPVPSFEYVMVGVKDLCVQFAGGPMWMLNGSLSSNVVHVPYQAIAHLVKP